MKNEMLRELENYSSKLSNIKEDKNVDDKMLSLVDIIRQRFIDFKNPYTIFFDSITLVKKLSQEEQTPILIRLQQTLSDKISKIINKDSADYKHFMSDVNQTFKSHLEYIPAKEEFDTTALVRKWRVECAWEIDLKKDGKVIWTESGTDFPGSWELKKRTLIFHLDNGQVLKYPVYYLSSKFMMISNEMEDGNTFNLGCCPI
jgi:hypothetical protein